MAGPSTRLTSWPIAPLIARLTIGWVFVATGWGKLHNLQGIIEYFTELGIPYPQYQAPFASANEFVLVGLATRIASIPLIIVMFVAIKTAQWGNVDSLSSFFGLTEWAYVAIFAWLAIAGPGPISLDRLIASAANRQEI